MARAEERGVGFWGVGSPSVGHRDKAPLVGHAKAMTAFFPKLNGFSEQIYNPKLQSKTVP